MDRTEALTHLDKLFSASGLEGLQKFAAAKGIKWTTVYAWRHRRSIPEWRLGLFKRQPKKSNA